MCKGSWLLDRVSYVMSRLLYKASPPLFEPAIFYHLNPSTHKPIYAAYLYPLVTYMQGFEGFRALDKYNRGPSEKITFTRCVLLYDYFRKSIYINSTQLAPFGLHMPNAGTAAETLIASKWEFLALAPAFDDNAKDDYFLSTLVGHALWP